MDPASVLPSLNPSVRTGRFGRFPGGAFGGPIGEKGIHEKIDIENVQVIHLLPHAHVADRESEGLSDGHHDAALRCSVELGEDQTLYRNRLGENAGLGQAVLARDAVHHEQGPCPVRP